MEVTIQDSSGTQVLVGDSNIDVPVSGYTDPTLGPIAANEYAEFTTTALHFPTADTYTIWVTYTTATETFYSDSDTIVVTAIGS